MKQNTVGKKAENKIGVGQVRWRQRKTAKMKGGKGWMKNQEEKDNWEGRKRSTVFKGEG